MKKKPAEAPCMSCGMKLSLKTPVEEVVCARCQKRLSTARHIERMKFHRARIDNAKKVVGHLSKTARDVDLAIAQAARKN